MNIKKSFKDVERQFLVVSFSLLFLGGGNVAAQDILVTTDGEVKNVYDVEMNGESVFYRSENRANASFERIEKSKVFAIKRKDGSKVSLDSPQGAKKESNATVDEMKPSSSSDVAQMNEAKINEMNSFLPKIEVEASNKEAKRLFFIMGYGKGSQLINEDVEVETVSGVWDAKNEKGRTVQTLMSAPSLAQYYEMGVRTFNPVFVVKIKNKSKKVIYVDLGNTFFIRPENTTAYYIPSSITNTSSSEKGIGLNMGAVAGALGVGGVVGTLANGVNVGGGKVAGTSNTVYSQRVIAIPPMAAKSLEAQPLFLASGRMSKEIYLNPVFSTDDLFLIPLVSLKNEAGKPIRIGEVLSYDEESSPLKYGVFLSYSFSEDCNDEKSLSINYYLRNIMGFRRAPGGEFDSYAQRLTTDIPDARKCFGFVGVGKDVSGK